MAGPLRSEPGDLVSDLPDSAHLTPSQASSPSAQRSSRPLHRGRFLLVYGLLGLVLGAAVAGLVVLAVNPGAKPSAPWSAWEPTGDAAGWPQQIADRVSAEYHLRGGSQLVGVKATAPQVQNIPIGAIAIRTLPPAGTTQVPVDVLQPAGAVVYIMCGLGQNCSIAQGTPSTERLRLLRREALELALYTFRYVDGKDSVVAFLPPAPGAKPTLALFFRKGDLSSELDRPLRLTLPDPEAPLPNAIRPSEIVTIDRLTGPSLYRFQFQQLQDGTAVLVLDDPRLPAPTQQTQGTQGQSGQTGQSQPSQTTKQ